MYRVVWLFVTAWTVAHQVPLSMEYSRQECWAGLPSPTPGDLPHPGIGPPSLASSASTGRFFTTAPPGKPAHYYSSDMGHFLTPGITLVHFRSRSPLLLSTKHPGGAGGKVLVCQFRRHKRLRFCPWVGKIPFRRAWQPTPVFLPGESHGQRSLAGCSP